MRDRAGKVALRWLMGRAGLEVEHEADAVLSALICRLRDESVREVLLRLSGSRVESVELGEWVPPSVEVAEPVRVRGWSPETHPGVRVVRPGERLCAACGEPVRSPAVVCDEVCRSKLEEPVPEPKAVRGEVLVCGGCGSEWSRPLGIRGRKPSKGPCCR